LNKSFKSIAILFVITIAITGLFFIFTTLSSYHQTFAQVISGTKEAIEQANKEAGEDQTVGVGNETNSNIIEQLKPVSDEMLEFSAEKLGINLSLPRETNIQILNRIFEDPEVGLQSLKNLDDAIDSLDDHLNVVQEKLYIECTVNKELGLFNKTLDCTKWSVENAKGAPVPIY
jgi:hypothetical protein